MDLLQITQAITTILSFIGPIVMIIIYFSIPDIRSFSMKLVISLSSADLIYSISNILAYWRENQAICTIAGVLNQVSVISAALWAGLFSYVAYKSLLNQRDLSKNYNKYLVFNIIISLMQCLWPLSEQIFFDEQAYIDIGVICVPTPKYLIVSFWLPVVSIVFMIFYYYLILRIAREYGSYVLEKFRSGLIYPAILLIAWIPTIANRVLISYFNIEIYALTLIQTLLFHSQGFFNFLAYGKTHFHRISKKKKKKNTLSMGINAISMAAESVNSEEGLIVA